MQGFNQMGRMIRSAALAGGLLCITAEQAQAAESLQTWGAISEGFRREATIARLPAAAVPSRLDRAPSDQALARRDPDIAAGFDALMRPRDTRILMVSQNRRVIYEAYAEDWLRKSTPLGYSMSKSLTALAVGKALCSGAISSLQQHGDAILPELAGTAWGDATVEQLLRMQSGSTYQEPSRSGWQSEAAAVENRGVYTGRMVGNFLDLMRRHDERRYQPGEQFQYNNYDTTALGLLVEAATGRKFWDFFNETIWQPVGPRQTGAWLVNGAGQTAAYAGFSAAPEDWIRLGHFVIEAMQKPDDCFARYLAEAIKPVQKTFIPTRCYGYQIWNWCSTDSFMFFGYGGQYLVINPRRGVVMYAHQASNANDPPMMALYQRVLKLP